MSLSTSPILAASASNDLAGVRWLIEHDAVSIDFLGDWFVPEAHGAGRNLERKRRTPLMIAALHGSLEVLNYLLQAGADPNARSEDDERCTAMHCAASGGSALSTEAIKTLILFGADRNACDAMGRQPVDVLPTSGGADNLLGGAHGANPANGGSGNSTSNNEPDDETRLSDDFRMYEFKVRRCSRTRAHDWTECPFTHPGEKARRRDPRRFNYCGTACPEFRKGSCPRGDACEFAHGVFECWLHPSRYRTQLCKDGMQCTRRACFFAHASNQLRVPTDAFGNALGRSSPTPSGNTSPTGHPLPLSPRSSGSDGSDGSGGAQSAGSNGAAVMVEHSMNGVPPGMPQQAAAAFLQAQQQEVIQAQQAQQQQQQEALLQQQQCMPCVPAAGMQQQPQDQGMLQRPSRISSPALAHGILAPQLQAGPAGLGPGPRSSFSNGGAVHPDIISGLANMGLTGAAATTPAGTAAATGLWSGQGQVVAGAGALQHAAAPGAAAAVSRLNGMYSGAAMASGDAAGGIAQQQGAASTASQLASVLGAAMPRHSAPSNAFLTQQQLQQQNASEMQRGFGGAMGGIAPLMGPGAGRVPVAGGNGLSLPRESSFQHLGMIEGVLGHDE